VKGRGMVKGYGEGKGMEKRRGMVKGRAYLGPCCCLCACVPVVSSLRCVASSSSHGRVVILCQCCVVILCWRCVVVLHWHHVIVGPCCLLVIIACLFVSSLWLVLLSIVVLSLSCHCAVLSSLPSHVLSCV